MITWGSCRASMMFVHGAASFYALRFLLGVAEAGFFPGMILYLTYWFPSGATRAQMPALFMTATPVAERDRRPALRRSCSSSTAAGLHGWQWLFLSKACRPVLSASWCCSC